MRGATRFLGGRSVHGVYRVLLFIVWCSNVYRWSIRGVSTSFVFTKNSPLMLFRNASGMTRVVGTVPVNGLHSKVVNNDRLTTNLLSPLTIRMVR